MEAGGLDRGAEPGFRVRDLGIRRHDVDAFGRQHLADGHQARRQDRGAGSVRLDRTRPARDVRAAAADNGPRPGQRQGPSTRVIDEKTRPPTRSASMSRPRPRLVDVAAGRLDRAGIPILELVRLRVAEVQSAAPYAAALPLVPTPPRRRDHWTRTRWALS